MNKTHYIILILLFLFIALVCCWAIYGNIGLILEVEAQESVTIPPPANPNDTFTERLPYPKEEYKSYIKLVAREQWVDPTLALRIANAESEFRNVNNTNGSKFGIGIFQIVQSTFDEQCQGDIYNEADNINCAIKMMSKNQYYRWNPSKLKWQY